MLESSEEAFEGFGVFRSFKANSYRIFGRPWSSRKKGSGSQYFPPKIDLVLLFTMLLIWMSHEFSWFRLAINGSLIRREAILLADSLLVVSWLVVSCNIWGRTSPQPTPPPPPRNISNMKMSFTKLIADTTWQGLKLGKNMNMSGCKWYEKGINFTYVDKWWCLPYLKNCNAAALSIGQCTANLTYNM